MSNEWKQPLKHARPFMAEFAMAEVSVVIPCYRCQDTIERAVASVAAQTLIPAEVILVEDRSGNGTMDALHALQNRYPEGWVHVIRQPENLGPGEARNAGWERAEQPYIAFLDADDSWHPQKIEIQYRWMCKHPDVVLTGHAVRRLADDEEATSASCVDTMYAEFYLVTRNRLLWSNRFPTRSVMLHRNLSSRFAPGKYYSEDYLLWLSIACEGKKIARCDLPLAFLHKATYGQGGLSGQLWRMQKGQLDTYAKVLQSGCIGKPLYAFLVAWSCLRFLRRALI
jgi:glycosyltransferase involved in cell wall biosynthesis